MLTVFDPHPLWSSNLTASCAVQASNHEAYSRLFVHQRIGQVFATLNKSGSGEVTVQELQDYLLYLNYKATKQQIHDMVWEEPVTTRSGPNHSNPHPGSGR